MGGLDDANEAKLREIVALHNIKSACLGYLRNKCCPLATLVLGLFGAPRTDNAHGWFKYLALEHAVAFGR